VRLVKELLGILGILILLFELYRYLRKYWLRRLLERKKKEKRTRKPAVLRPKSERDCRFCCEDKGKPPKAKREMPVAWQLRKGRGGRKKKIRTEEFFCPNKSCEYYGITEEAIHALVGYGTHGRQEVIQDFKCQACGKKFTARKNTILYRLKSHSGLIERILWLLVLGVDASALEEVFAVREITIRTWLCRSGMQGKKLHERFMIELELIHVQLDELWANVKDRGQDIWLWIASDAKTKIIPVMQVGARNQEMAYSVVHELKGRLAVGRVPVFSTDGLKHYFYALTAHFGRWEKMDGKKHVWVLLSDFVYSQVIKHQRRRKTVEVERRVLVGEIAQYTGRLQQAGLSGRINTAFVERVNLTIRQCVSKLTRRTWGPAKFTPELMEHLEWWRSYYHFVRPHESLVEELTQPVQRKGKQQARKYRKRTPAMLAGLTNRRWTVKELLLYPLP
jgi:IS1 family transposase/transposase-like protein